MRSNQRKPARPQKSDGEAILLGVGLDGDGEKRVTRGKEFVLLGGSAETHEVMQEKAIRFSEELSRRGKRLGEVRNADELREIADRAGLSD